MNGKQFSELFHKNAGASPLQYLTAVRMSHAKKLLLGGEIPVNELAELVGYADPYYFSRQFKKYNGISPTQFRRRENIHADSEKSPFSNI